jgi:hypothetical protein
VALNEGKLNATDASAKVTDADTAAAGIEAAGSQVGQRCVRFGERIAGDLHWHLNYRRKISYIGSNALPQFLQARREEQAWSILMAVSSGTS